MPFGLSAVAVKAIGIGLLVLALLAGFAWFVHSERTIGAQQCEANVAAAQAQEHAKVVALNQRNDELSAKLIAAQAARKTTYATITRNVDRIVDRPVYRDHACLDADGLRLVNAALAGTAPDPGGAASAVPAASAASGNNGG
jgi:hypothetical protein